MSKAPSIDLRVRVLAAVSAGATHREAAERFGVSAASVSRWRNLQLRQSEVRPGPLSRRLQALANSGEIPDGGVTFTIRSSLAQDFWLLLSCPLYMRWV